MCQEKRKGSAWHIDKAILPLLVISVAVGVFILHGELVTHLGTHFGRTFNFGLFLNCVIVILFVLGVLKLVSSGLEPSPNESGSEESYLQTEKEAFMEYEIGNKLAQEYFKAQWTAISIFIPICFGLIAASFYTREIMGLRKLQILPMAGASIFLYLYGWAYQNRYTSYCRSIWKRLRHIEDKNRMYLHHGIHKDDNARTVRWRMKHVNFIVVLLLLFLWGIRIWYAPLV